MFAVTFGRDPIRQAHNDTHSARCELSDGLRYLRQNADKVHSSSVRMNLGMVLRYQNNAFKNIAAHTQKLDPKTPIGEATQKVIFPILQAQHNMVNRTTEYVRQLEQTHKTNLRAIRQLVLPLVRTHQFALEKASQFLFHEDIERSLRQSRRWWHF